MRCISPLLVRNNGRRDFVPCGQCNFCLQTKRADWSFRLQQEAKHAKTKFFLTLTYEDENIQFSKDGQAELRKTDLQLFTKRIRKQNAGCMGWPMRYYAVGEYGTITARPHYHMIIFNLHEEIAKRLERFWTVGFAHVGDVTDASIHYVTKYVINKPGDYGGREPPFALMSRRPGLGAAYVDTHRKWHKSDMRNFTKNNGIIRRIPRYLKDKIFDQFDRRYLAQDAINIADLAYWNEIERLKTFHNDPLLYYDESLNFSHDRVHNKINTINKF